MSNNFTRAKQRRRASILQDWLGHANIQNTVIYSQISVGNREARAREPFQKMSKF